MACMSTSWFPSKGTHQLAAENVSFRVLAPLGFFVFYLIFNGIQELAPLGMYQGSASQTGTKWSSPLVIF